MGSSSARNYSMGKNYSMGNYSTEIITGTAQEITAQEIITAREITAQEIPVANPEDVPC